MHGGLRFGHAAYIDLADHVADPEAELNKLEDLLLRGSLGPVVLAQVNSPHRTPVP